MTSETFCRIGNTSKNQTTTSKNSNDSLIQILFNVRRLTQKRTFILKLMMVTRATMAV